MKCIASCETFRRAGKTTQPALPTLPEKRVSDKEVKSILETIDEILAEFDQPTHVFFYKNTFLESFMQEIDHQITQFLNDCFIK
jgi:hypothetical protein